MGAQDAGVSALAKALMYNKGLTELDLRNNGITASGGTALGYILASNTGLRRVDLRYRLPRVAFRKGDLLRRRAACFCWLCDAAGPLCARHFVEPL